MGSFCSPSPATSTTNQQQTYAPNPAIAASGSQALNMAGSAASAPFQMPAAPVAGFNPFQTQAFNQTQGIQGGLEPFFNQATGEQTIGQQPVNQSDIAANMNPFAQGSLADLKKYIFDPQRTQTMGNAVQTAGGQSADRLALTSQNLDKTQGDALTQAESGFYGQAYSQAAAAKQQALQSAQGWAQLGLGQQGGQLQATGALAGAGAQQQALSQAQLNSPYQQQLAQIAYPFQTAQFLAGITGGLAPAFGGTTSGQSNSSSLPSQPSPLNQIIGGGLAATGLAGGLGAFSGGNGTAGYGGTSPGTVAGGYNSATNAPSYANPYGGSWYLNRGGAIGYADGGGVEDDPGPYSGIIPQMKLPMGGGENTGGHLNLSPPPTPSSGQSGGSGGMDIGKIASMAMMFMNRGGKARGYAEGGGPTDDYNTRLDPDQEKNFQAWKSQIAPNDTGADYDLRGAYLANFGRYANGHMGDQFKKPNHPTFSNQSENAKYYPELAGSWNGDQYIPGPGRMDSGGTVNPANAGMGYASGGISYSPTDTDVYENLGNPYDSKDSAPGVPRTPGEVFKLGLQSVADRYNNWSTAPDSTSSLPPASKQSGLGKMLGLPDVGSIINSPASAGAVVPQPQSPQPFNYPMPANSGWPNAPMQMPNANQPSPAPGGPQASAMPPAPSGGSGLPRASSNPDMNVRDWNMPKDQTPYPDALSRDSGQNLARSPWLALLNAGAKTMQSTKGGIGGLGEGIEAGTKTLADQRKELRSEEAINQKAEELYRHAKSELLKYTRKTPHELATEHLAQERLNQERYTWQSGTGVDPTTGQPTYGAYRLPTKQGESPQFFPGAGISGRSGAQSTALMRNIQGLVEAGIAPDKQAAFGLLHQSVNSPAVYRRLVQAQEKILQNDPDWIGRNSTDRRLESERIVKQGQDAAAQAGNSQTSGTQPGATASSALPDPGDGNRVSGMWYINPGTGKPDRWR